MSVRTRVRGVRPRARIYTREKVVVCCLHRLVLSFRRISVHIVTFFTFFRFGSRREAELCGVSPHCGGVLWGVSPHCGPHCTSLGWGSTTLRFACMVLLALRACSLSEAAQGMLFQYEHTSVTAFPVGVLCQLLTAFRAVNKKPAKIQFFCIYYTIFMRESAILLQGAGGQGVGWWGAACA